jgi:hypothetical protein
MINVESIMESKYELDAFDLEIIGNVMRGLLNNPDIIDDETLVTVLNLMQMVSDASIYAHKPLDSNTTQVLWDAYSNAFVKINHSYKQRRAMKDTLLLGMGLNI